jgi:hypothetical protein
MRTVRDVGQACQRSAPSFPILRVSREEFLYELKAGPAGGLRPPSGPAATRREPGGCRPTLGRVEPNRSSGREPEGSTPAAVHRSSLSGIRFWRVLPRFAIRENVRLAEAPSHHEPITMSEPYSTGAADYRELAHELMKGGR